jgi:hypothetical protein
MYQRDLVFRLLLAGAIVLNGMGAAVAGASHDHAPPCHGDHAMTEQAMAEHVMDDMPQPDHRQPPAQDCCEAGQCACACMQPVQAPPPARIAASAPPGVPVASPPASGRCGPVLPHPIRPPIG